MYPGSHQQSSSAGHAAPPHGNRADAWRLWKSSNALLGQHRTPANYLLPLAFFVRSLFFLTAFGAFLTAFFVAFLAGLASFFAAFLVAVFAPAFFAAFFVALFTAAFFAVFFAGV